MGNWQKLERRLRETVYAHRACRTDTERAYDRVLLWMTDIEAEHKAEETSQAEKVEHPWCSYCHAYHKTSPDCVRPPLPDSQYRVSFRCDQCKSVYPYKDKDGHLCVPRDDRVAMLSEVREIVREVVQQATIWEHGPKGTFIRKDLNVVLRSDDE
jgi:hypothetical protein